MATHPRFERADMACLNTIGTRNSELWFVNNKPLHLECMGHVAKCAKRYGVEVYAIAFEGTHVHDVSLYPNMNRADFKRDTNSAFVRAVKRNVPAYPGGSLWHRRYSSEFVPTHLDIKERFFYTFLQPMQDGICERISEFLGYHGFNDAIWGRELMFKTVDWTAFNKDRKRDPTVHIKDYTEIISFKFTRLPGYEHLSQEEYAHLMKEEFEVRRQAIVAERKAEGKGFLGIEGQRAIRAGQRAKNPKRSTRDHRRPRVLSIDPRAWKETMTWYFQIYFRYKEASRRYRAGDITVEFPQGTYKPYIAVRPPPE
jgi:hypothetical protein